MLIALTIMTFVSTIACFLHFLLSALIQLRFKEMRKLPSMYMTMFIALGWVISFIVTFIFQSSKSIQPGAILFCVYLQVVGGLIYLFSTFCITLDIHLTVLTTQFSSARRQRYRRWYLSGTLLLSLLVCLPVPFSYTLVPPNQAIRGRTFVVNNYFFVLNDSWANYVNPWLTAFIWQCSVVLYCFGVTIAVLYKFLRVKMELAKFSLQSNHHSSSLQQPSSVEALKSSSKQHLRQKKQSTAQQSSGTQPDKIFRRVILRLLLYPLIPIIFTTTGQILFRFLVIKDRENNLDAIIFQMLTPTVDFIVFLVSPSFSLAWSKWKTRRQQQQQSIPQIGAVTTEIDLDARVNI